MKRMAAVYLATFLSLSTVARPDEVPNQIAIWRQFYFDKGVDYTQFSELGTARTQFRRVYVDEIAALQELGAKPLEAEAVLLALDAHYLDTLDQSAKGIEASFTAEFRSALVAQYERTYKPQRLVMTEGANFGRGASTAQDAETPQGVDMVAWGTWSNIDGNVVRVSVDFVMIATGKMVSFTSQGTVPTVADDIAFQLFDYFEKTRYPQPDNSLSNLDIRPALPGHQDRMGVPFDVAKRACESQGYRLPYSYEMDLIYAMGAYQPGGVHIAPDWYYCVADDADHVWRAPGKLEPIYGMHLANYDKRDFYYVMVKGAPSSKVQIAAALDAFLKRESPTRDAAHNALAIDAARLLLAKLDSKRPITDVAERNLAQKFAAQHITPWDYLKTNGLAPAIGLSPTLVREMDRIAGSAR